MSYHRIALRCSAVVATLRGVCVCVCLHSRCWVDGEWVCVYRRFATKVSGAKLVILVVQNTPQSAELSEVRCRIGCAVNRIGDSAVRRHSRTSPNCWPTATVAGIRLAGASRLVAETSRSRQTVPLDVPCLGPGGVAAQVEPTGQRAGCGVLSGRRAPCQGARLLTFRALSLVARGAFLQCAAGDLDAEGRGRCRRTQLKLNQRRAHPELAIRYAFKVRAVPAMCTRQMRSRPSKLNTARMNWQKAQES